MKTPKDYIVYHHTDYEPFPSRGFTVIEVLPFLKGKPWDEYALAYLQALRPSYVRVSTGMITCDARNWRVTVFIHNDNTIRRIEQEVEVGLPDDVHHGSHLDTIVRSGKGSLKDQWQALEGVETSWSLEIEGRHISRYYKTLSDGTIVPYPKEGDTELTYEKRDEHE
jgi:hypothetical protein